MPPSTLDWVESAEMNYGVVRLLLRRRCRPLLLDALCLHAQACVETYLKARAAAAGLPIPRSSRLRPLLASLARVEPAWAGQIGDVAGWDDHAIAIGYPGRVTTRAEAVTTARTCRRWRTRVRASLGV